MTDYHLPVIIEYDPEDDVYLTVLSCRGATPMGGPTKRLWRTSKTPSGSVSSPGFRSVILSLRPN